MSQGGSAGGPGLGQLVRAVDNLEAQTDGYLFLERVEPIVDAATLRQAIQQDVLLVDYRQRLDAASGEARPATVCRLNRHHPLVRRVTAADTG